MSYLSTILGDNPTAYWRLDETSGLVAHDSSGNGYNATLPASGITYGQPGAIVGDTDTSMLFSSTATLALPYTLNPSTWTALSLEFWIKLTSGWQYVVVTTSNSGSTITYLNGAVYGSGTGDTIVIDDDIYYAGSPLSGNLDEIGLYSYVMTPTQIVTHYLAGLNAAAFYASNVAQTISSLILSDKMSQTTGGTETSVSVTAPSSGTNTYVELLSQGGTSSGTLALPAPTGKGWSIPLQGNTIPAGSWSSLFTLAKSGTAMSGGSLIMRYSRRTMDGTYYPIAISTLTGQSFSTKATYVTPQVSAKLWQFISNDTLYVDAFVWNGSTAWASDVFTLYISNSASQGVYGDGTVLAPQIQQTAPGLTYLCGIPNFQTLNALPVSNQAFNLADALDQRSIVTLTGEDAPGTTSTPRGTPVILSDHDQGLLFTGNTQSDEMTHPAVGSNPQIEHAHTDHDNHYWFDKDPNETNYANWYGGDVVCDFLRKLAVEGVSGQYAIEADYTPDTFSEGTLSGVVATTTTSPFTYAPNTLVPPITTNTGDLELVRAGTQFLLTEQTTSDFSSGTLTNVTATSNTLKPTTQSAIRFIAQFPLTVAGVNLTASYINSTNNSKTFTTIGLSSPPLLSASYNPGSVSNFCNAEIWSGSMTVASFDTLNYDIWIASTSPSYQAVVNLTFSDGSKLSDYGQEIADDPTVSHEGVYDQTGVSSDPLTDLSKYAKDCWFTRAIPCNLVTGKTITSVNIQIQGGSNGNYTVYIKNCYLGSQSGSPFFSTSATHTQVNPAVITSGSGFGGGFVDVVQVYQPAVSQRFSPAHSISSVGLVQNSTITWIASLPTTSPYTNIVYPPGTIAPQSSNTTQSAMNIYVSYDNATWLLCTNQGALPGLPPGANVVGLSLYLLEQFEGGSDPTAIPSLLNVTITINSAAAQTTTTDIVASYGTTAEWNTGTYNATTTNSSGDLINGGTYTPNFNTFNYTYWARTTGSGSHLNITTAPTSFTFSDTADTGTITMVASMNDVLPVTNGTITCNISIADGGSNQWGRAGVIYRAANWQALTSYTPDGTAFDLGLCPAMVGYLVYIWYDTAGSSFGVALVALNPSSLPTSIAWVGQSISSGTTYQLTVNYTNERHQIYFSGYSTTIPIIDMSDSTYLEAGGVGLYAIGTLGNGPTCDFTAQWSNFSITPLATGFWESPSINLSSLATCGYTQICWSEINKNYAPQSTAGIFTSLDSGSSWQQCQNGAEIPLLTPGTSVSSLLIKVLLYSNPDMTTPSIIGLYARVCGHYGTVTGSRISPALNLSPVTYESSSNVMYNANTPTGTSIAVSTSINAGSSWETVPNSGAGAALGYWTPQPSPTQDLFNTNTLANYTNTSKTGGSAATVLYTTAQSQLSLTGGSFGLYLSNAPTAVGDIELACCMRQSDTGGLVWHYVDGSNYYELVAQDASSSGGSPNALQLYKISSGTRTLLATASITFTRGTFHIPKIVMEGGLINAYWDGQCLISYLDTSPLGSGLVGLRNSGGTALFYQIWIQPLGTNLSGVGLQTKVTLSTSDPQYMPQLFVLVCAVRGPHITQGQQIYQMHPLTVPFAAYYSSEMDVLTQADGDSFWYVDKWGECFFQSRYARLGAFPLQTNHDPANASGELLYTPPLKVTTSSDTFRNQQIVTNVTTLVTPPIEYKVSDGAATSWTLGYPVYSTPIITFVNSNQAATVGVQGIDNNRQFYWQPGSPTISYDSSLPVLPNGTIFSVQYVGQSINNVIINNTASQAERQAAEGNSGIVCEIESALRSTTIGMTTAQATAFANGLLSRNGINSAIEVLGTTMYGGLKPGFFVPVFAPEFGIWNAQLPIIKITTTALPAATGLPVYQYLIDSTNGANISNWQRVFGIA
jgi:hypothetical protein